VHGVPFTGQGWHREGGIFLWRLAAGCFSEPTTFWATAVVVVLLEEEISKFHYTKKK